MVDLQAGGNRPFSAFGTGWIRLADPDPLPWPLYRHQPHSLQFEQPFGVHHQAAHGFPGKYAVEAGVAGSSSSVVPGDLGVLFFHHLAIFHVLPVIVGLTVCQGFSQVGDRLPDLYAAEVTHRALEPEFARPALVSLEPEYLPFTVLARKGFLSGLV
jgi:hypothetical protein